MADRDFFESKNPQAVLKHGLLSRYAHYFAGRAGHATGGKIAFIDGYSGAGRYEDGSPGSPLLLASSAKLAETINRDVMLAFVEPDALVRNRLEVNLRDSGVTYDVLLDRPLEDVVDGLLDRYSNRAVLLFVDPFGLALSYETLTRVLRRSREFGPVDVLLHFSTLSIARMGRAAVKGSGAVNNASLLDRALGPVDWRSALEDLPDVDGAPTQAAIEVAQQFNAAIAMECGIPSLSIPVRKRPGHVPLFMLTLFCRDPVGKALWDFADMAGKACVDWLLRCETDDYASYLERQEVAPSLFPLDEEPTEAEINKVLSVRAGQYLPGHICNLVRVAGRMCLQDDPAAVYGELLGVAREKHVRVAMNQLVDQGLVEVEVAGQVRKATYAPVARSSP
jgi:three-Cys-motif partner protein